MSICWTFRFVVYSRRMGYAAAALESLGLSVKNLESWTSPWIQRIKISKRMNPYKDMRSRRGEAGE